MKIKWFGHSCFMVTAENGTKILTDPYINMEGYKLPEIEADIVSTSHDHRDHNNVNAVKGSFIHINETGSFLKHGIEIKGVETFHDKFSGVQKGKNTIFSFKVDGLNVCHCGDLGHILDPKQIEELGNVDILLLPTGGGYTIGPNDALKVMEQLKPRVVIPMHYRTEALGPKGQAFAEVDEFIRASGVTAKEYDELTLNKATIKDHLGIAVLKYE